MNRWENRQPHSRVVLIRPAVSRWQLYGRYTPFGSHEPPLGLLYIASYLKMNAIEVTLLDGEQIGENGVMQRLRSNRPGIVGLTTTTFSFDRAAALASRIRKEFPDCLLIMGGAHVTALPKDTLNRVPALDACVIGEGEETTLEISQGIAPGDVRGLLWRDQHNRVHQNPARVETADLDKYPLSWECLEKFPSGYGPGMQDQGLGKAISLVASRGCGYHCTFCAGPIIHGGVRRAHSPQFVVDLMKNLNSKYGITNFYFHDDNFTQDRHWLKEFCNGILLDKLDLNWSCASRVEPLTQNVLRDLKSAGCFQIGIGLESASETVLQWLNKGVDFDTMRDRIADIHTFGIKTKLYLIIGTPIESLRDIAATWLHVLQLSSSHIQVIYFTPLPGTSDGDRVGCPPNKWYRMNLLNSVAVPLMRRPFLRFVEFGLYATFYSKTVLNALLTPRTNHRHTGETT